MALKGNLKDTTVSDLIQMGCRGRNEARLLLRSQGQQASIFFDGGQVVHAESGADVGEEVVYELLSWEEGDFELEMDVSTSERTITANWSGLLLEGMRRIDERVARRDSDSLEQSIAHHREVQKMATKKRSEQLADALSELLSSSSDIEGGALVGIDGLVLSSNVPIGKLDETLVGAAAAAISGLSRRSVEQMQRGEFFQTLIQGSKGNIIVTFVDERNVFVGLTPANVNLGMAFHEARQVAQELAAIMG